MVFKSYNHLYVGWDPKVSWCRIIIWIILLFQLLNDYLHVWKATTGLSVSKMAIILRSTLMERVSKSGGLQVSDICNSIESVSDLDHAMIEGLSADAKELNKKDARLMNLHMIYAILNKNIES